MKLGNIITLIITALILTTCKQNNTIMINPLLTEFNTVHNSVPFDKINPEHFRPAINSAIEITKKEIQDIINNNETPSFENTVVALERSGKQLSQVSGVLFNLNVANTNPDIQNAAKEISPILTDFRNDIILNEKLFARIKSVYDNSDMTLMDTEDKMLLEKNYKNFVRNGANLSSEDKIKYRAITNELSSLTVEFGENVLAETNDFILHVTSEDSLAGLPKDQKTEAKSEAERRNLDGWVFTLQFPSYGPFLKYADNRELRKNIYIASNTRCLHDNEHNNSGLIKRITELRIQLANVLGFDNYADFVLSNRMAEGTDRVNTFLNDLLIASIPVAKSEYKELQKFAQSTGADFNLEAWDWAYYSEKLKKEKFDINDEATRPYFQLENVEKGVFGLANTLFGLSLKQVHNVPVYHEDVKVFEVFDENNEFLSLLYMDYFPRESKKGGAWMTEYLTQHIDENGKDVRPHVSLVFNFTKPMATKPSLLTFSEVTTLLHEFGHGLHGMLSNCKYSGLAGTNVYLDFVELPSQILENWAEQKEWLDKIAMHYETGETIPKEMVQKIIDSKNFNTGYFSTRQLSFGMADMKWHSLIKPYTGDIPTFEKDAMAPTRVLPHVEGTASSTAFSHIFSGMYAAGYYSYKWAEVLDADAFAYFKEKGVFNKEVAKQFQDNILSKGGTEHPMELYKKFRGKEPSVDALLERSGLK